MQSPPSDGREFLLNELSSLPTPTQDVFLSRLFETNDRVSKSVIYTAIQSTLPTTQARESHKFQSWLNSSGRRWTSDAIEMLDQFDQDISIAQQITWDRNVLKDAVALMDFLIHSCNAVWDELVTACRSCSGESADSLGGLADSLERSKARAIDSLRKLRVKQDLTSDNFEPNANHKIPTATLRELFVLNEAHQKREEIWSCVDDTLQLPDANSGSNRKGEKAAMGDGKAPLQSKSIDEIVLSIFSALRERTEALPNKENAWRSRTLALVLDTEKRIILTGGTKPKCHESGLFSKAVKTMTNLRMGETFTEIIKSCSREFEERANDQKRLAPGLKIRLDDLAPSEIGSLYDQVVDFDEYQHHDRIPGAREAQKVLSWACDENFESKPPCLRCQCFYTRWVLNKSPSKDMEKKEALRGLFGRLVSKNPSKSAYCAETVAASKLYLLRNGTLALVE